ncbi:MAG TPA: DUF2959 family protein [Candidatus Paceibacterota bacterium]|nr:DUF2959 family protein [Verrucomicrobiota bacterium]HSA09900.1 DUF2959 family protein [Candidatus Paceibacterota bacterium]
MNTNQSRKSRASRQILLAATLALAGALVAGCRTTVYQPGDQAAGTARAAAVHVQKQSQMLESTMAALNNLVSNPAADLKPQFQSFSSALDRLVEAANQGGTTGGHLVRDNATFFNAWDQQLTTITNTDVRSSSQARRTEVNNQFTTVHNQYAQAQGALWSHLDYLREIRKALVTDLTAGGLESVKPLVSTATSNAGNVQTALAQARSDLLALSTAMSSAGGPTGK